MPEVKCTLTFDAKLGPVVEIGKRAEKTEERIDQIILADPRLHHTHMRRSSLSTKLKDEVWSSLYHQILEKSEHLLSIETELFVGACNQVKGQTIAIIELCKVRSKVNQKVIAEMDLSASHAIQAFELNYCRPHFIADSCSHTVVGGRHPVVESYQLGRGNQFIVNNSQMNESNRIVLLTGPNMGGKSTYLRQCALISIMAQTGLFVPAAMASLGIIDQVFTRIGSSDNLSANQSTFMVIDDFNLIKVEMKETAAILNNASSRSLVIMDEVGRGTSTNDGLALALAILQHLESNNKSLCIFATHYHELAGMITNINLPHISFYQAAARVDKNDTLTCLHKIVPGVMDRSHGIQIAEMAGLPTSVVANASSIYKSLT
jgi:DNA mismatch repair protein MutS